MCTIWKSWILLLWLLILLFLDVWLWVVTMWDLLFGARGKWLCPQICQGKKKKKTLKKCGQNFLHILRLGPLHTWDWEPMTITLQPLSLVEKEELIQICFTLCSRDQRTLWMQGGCNVHMDSYMALLHGYLDYFQNPPLGGRPNTKSGDHGTPNTHNRCFILFYHVRGPTWIDIRWNNIWLRARSHMTSHYTRGSVTALHDFGGEFGRPLNTFFWALTISRSQLLARVWSGPKYLRTIFLGLSVNSFDDICDIHFEVFEFFWFLIWFYC